MLSNGVLFKCLLIVVNCTPAVLVLNNVLFTDGPTALIVVAVEASGSLSVLDVFVLIPFEF